MKSFSRFLSVAIIPILLTGVSVTRAWQSAESEPAPVSMPLVDTSGADVLNFLLLGSDTNNPRNSGRTDVIMVVSVNRTAGTAALLSIPRDLYIYMPDGEMQRINTVYGLAEQAQAGSGATLLMDVIRYNLGLQIDHYARVDFNDFKQIIDSVGGVAISVDCALQDWRLIAPDLDPTLEESWAKFTLPIGVHRMDGDLALWYARSRRTSSDFDRGQRQQEIMRALWRQLRVMGLLQQVPDVWPQLVEIVKTDVTLPDVLALIPFATSLELSRVASFTFRLNTEVVSWTAPDGAQVLLPQRDALISFMQDFVTPPTAFQLHTSQAKVRIVNVSGTPDLAVIAADRLSWQGFTVEIAEDGAGQLQQAVTIYDYVGRRKGGEVDTLKAALRVPDDGVVVMPAANRQFDYEVMLGWSYYACTRDVLAPVEELAAP